LQKKVSYLNLKGNSEVRDKINSEKLIKIHEENKELNETVRLLEEILEESQNLPCFKTRKEGSRELNVKKCSPHLLVPSNCKVFSELLSLMISFAIWYLEIKFA
jgi:hypothetical protein